MRLACAAAAADHAGARPYQSFCLPCKFAGGKRIRRLSIDDYGQPRIGFCNNRHTGARAHARQQRPHLFRPKAAVHANGICPKPFQQEKRRIDFPAREQLSRLIECHCGKYRQIAVFLCCQQRGLYFIGIAHRLNDDELSARLNSCLHHSSKSTVCFFKPQISYRA